MVFTLVKNTAGKLHAYNCTACLVSAVSLLSLVFMNCNWCLTSLPFLERKYILLMSLPFLLCHQSSISQVAALNAGCLSCWGGKDAECWLP